MASDTQPPSVDGDNDRSRSNHSSLNMILLIVLVVLIACICVACGVLYILRRRARSKLLATQHQLPLFNKSDDNSSVFSFGSQQVSQKDSSPIFVHRERQSLLDTSVAPGSPEVPEIRLTFPDDFDKATGKSQLGDSVIIHVGDKGLPSSSPEAPLLQSDAGRLESLDLDRIGGLREKPNAL